MTESTTLSREEINADDERRFEALRARLRHAELPSLRYAMWPGDFRTDLDVSEFNERYITIPFPELFIFLLYLASGWHTAALIFVATMIWMEGILGWSLLLGYMFLSIPAIGMMVFSYLALRLPAPIFDRQAQVIHKYHAGRVIHVPWQDIRPFLNFNVIGKALTFYSKMPQVVRQCSEQPFAKRFLARNEPFLGCGALLDPLDNITVEDNLQRLEFMRRYMEEGLSAVQPDPNITPRRPKHHPMKRARAEGFTLHRLFMEACYWFGLGPLVDLWVKWLRSKAVWPEEVQRLCEPGADLSGFDTQPIHPDPNVFYRYDAERESYYLCNRQGERID